MKTLYVTDHAMIQAEKRFGITDEEVLIKMVMEKYSLIEPLLSSEELTATKVHYTIGDIRMVLVNDENTITIKTVIPKSSNAKYDKVSRKQNKKEKRKLHWSKRVN